MITTEVLLYALQYAKFWIQEVVNYYNHNGSKKIPRQRNRVPWKKRDLYSEQIDRNPIYCKLLIDCIQNNDSGRIQMIKELIDVKDGNSYVPFVHNNDLETTFDYLCTY